MIVCIVNTVLTKKYGGPGKLKKACLTKNNQRKRKLNDDMVPPILTRLRRRIYSRTKYPLTRGDKLIIWNNVRWNDVMSGGDKHEALAECVSVSDGHYIVLVYINSK